MGPVVISLIGAPLELDELALVVELEAPALPLDVVELEELELLLPQAARLSEVTIATAITPRRWFTALSSVAPRPHSHHRLHLVSTVVRKVEYNLRA
ncbi:MAG TPA: hypothetical protein VMG37_19500 [Solirubrobacteraceae bacterium]|jgi:hypothetical protein|nr:hypothetical protein [Solirubrobacteraceae bacterium]